MGQAASCPCTAARLVGLSTRAWCDPTPHGATPRSLRAPRRQGWWMSAHCRPRELPMTPHSSGRTCEGEGHVDRPRVMVLCAWGRATGTARSPCASATIHVSQTGAHQCGLGEVKRRANHRQALPGRDLRGWPLWRVCASRRSRHAAAAHTHERVTRAGRRSPAYRPQAARVGRPASARVPSRPQPDRRSGSSTRGCTR